MLSPSQEHSKEQGKQEIKKSLNKKNQNTSRTKKVAARTTVWPPRISSALASTPSCSRSPQIASHSPSYLDKPQLARPLNLSLLRLLLLVPYHFGLSREFPPARPSSSPNLLLSTLLAQLTTPSCLLRLSLTALPGSLFPLAL